MKTSDFVPTNDYINVKVDAAVKVKIGTEKPELFKAATRNFLYKTPEEIADEIRDTLEGHLRAIIGQMQLSTIVTDRSQFAETVQTNATKDLEEMGLEIVAFNIQGLTDSNGVIENLGIDNTEQIRKEAAKAKAKAQQEIAQQQAESDKLANEARVKADLEIAQKQNDLAKKQAALQTEADTERAKADLEIAQKQNDLAKKQAALQTEADTERAKADAAYAIQQEIQRKEIERQSAEANIVREEKQAEVKEREVLVHKQTLAAEIEAQADAEKYARQQAAEAEKLERQAKAEAELFETQKEAEAKRAIAEANKFAQLQEAEAIRAKGEAEAKAIELKLLAEAEGLDKKAEAMKKYGQAAVTEMLVKALPDIAKAVATPLANVDSITMYGSDNSAKMVGDIMTTMNQVTNGMGLDVKELITATLTGRKMGEAIAESTTDVKIAPTIDATEN